MTGTFSYDTETHLSQPGLAAPPLVCASMATVDPGSETFLSKEQARAWFKQHIVDARIIGSHIFYDMGVMAADDPAQVDPIFRAFDEGRVLCTDVTEKLHDISRGMLFREPSSNQPFKSYHLARTSARYVPHDPTVAGQKWGEDSWRKRYAFLEFLPLHWWPLAATEYVKHDSRLAMDTAMGQARAPTQNRQCLVGEMRAAWALHLSAVWGMRTDPVLSPQVVGEIRQQHEESRRLFLRAGIVGVRTCKNKRDTLPDGSKSEPYLEKSDDITAEELEQAMADMPHEPWAAEARKDLLKACTAIRLGKPVRFCQRSERLRELVNVAYRGDPPMTAGGKDGANPEISTSRETLQESNDELLEDYGEEGPNEKLYAAFSDLLLEGMRVPINPQPNSLVESGRTSYREPNLQQLPRKSRVRECFVPRPGWVYCSVDYSTLELCTLAQACLWIVGKSCLADALNAGQDLHTRLAARIAGISYEEALQRKDAKDKQIVALRQLCKPINFGLPGGMGPPKLVATARKDGVRFCVLVGEARGRTRKGEPTCGPKVVTYGTGRHERKIAPTCEDCLRLAVKYRDLWREEWPEVPLYHDWIQDRIDSGQPLVSAGNGMLRLAEDRNSGANHYFQNLAAQGAKHALWLLSKECYTDRASSLWGSRPVVFVHDEIIAELPIFRAAVAGERMAQLMVAAMKQFVPDVKISAEPALMPRWYKGADTVRVNGRLQLWLPPCEDKRCKADGWKKACAPECGSKVYPVKRHAGDWEGALAA